VLYRAIDSRIPAPSRRRFGVVSQVVASLDLRIHRLRFNPRQGAAASVESSPHLQKADGFTCRARGLILSRTFAALAPQAAKSEGNVLLCCNHGPAGAVAALTDRLEFAAI
jgi:hypothetical protein